MTAPTTLEQDAHDEWAGIEYRNAVEFSARDLAISRAAWSTRAALSAPADHVADAGKLMPADHSADAGKLVSDGPVEQGEQG